MSKFHKIPIFLIIALVLTFTLASCGKEHEPNPPDPDDINNISEPTEKFIDFVDDCFENYDFFQVYNSEGTEMTVVALLDMSEFYREEDYQSIKNYLHENEYSMGYMDTVLYAGENTLAYRYVTGPVVTYPTVNTQEIILNATGAFEFDPYTYELIKVTSSGGNMEYCDFSGDAISFRSVMTESPSSILQFSDVTVKDATASRTSGMDITMSFRSRYLVDIKTVF